MNQQINKDRTTAEANQQLAADPRGSAVVEANAGSGKTHVLINRVTRILLDGAAPEQILCVTFTKAAASEMLNRLFGVLGRFSILPDAELGAELTKLDPHAPTDQKGLAKARRLFARALETPGGLKIRTIHGFCETLLRQFPVEAGISPGFRVLSETESHKLAQKLIAEISLQAVKQPDGELAAAFRLLGQSGSGQAGQVFQTAIYKAGALAADLLPTDGLQTSIEAAAAHLGVKTRDTETSICAASWAVLDKNLLQDITNAMSKGAATNQKKAAQLAELKQQSDPVVRFTALTKVFLKADFDRLKKLFSAGAAKTMPDWQQQIEPVFVQIENTLQQLWAVEALAMTKAALSLCEAFVRRYVQAKKHAGLLDFEDLIGFSKKLLTSQLSAAWVLYKMDGNLRHVLVDEAQDNSANQWAIIGALTAEFFAGAGAQQQTRTLFAVGDPKQSIYRFQGADPALFALEKHKMQTIGQTSDVPVYAPQLSLSWRSTPQVLQFVDACFATLDQRETKFVGDPKSFDKADSDPGFSSYMEHQAERANAAGSVTLLPPIAYHSAEPDTDPSRPVNAVSSTAPVSLLARNVAAMVKDMLARGTQIGERQQMRPVQAGDILILVRSRKDLFREIIRYLKQENLPVAGADRMTLQDETAVLDLLSLAKLALQPSDDLSLAELLKGPFLHPEKLAEPVITEQVLYDLARHRDKNETLISALMHSKTEELLEAKSWVNELIQRAGYENPYRFFSGLLYRRSKTGEAMIRRLFARLGPEAADPVQEFLALALAFTQEGDGTLLSFVAEMELREDTIKREMEDAGNQVRVMTVHGAKGLEAPVVILPDTNAKASGRTASGLVKHANCWFWAGTGQQVCLPIVTWRSGQELLDLQEHRRLLYVALTRARDHLLICGHERGDGKKDDMGFPADSWYRRCETAFKDLLKREQAEAQEVDGQICYRLGTAIQSDTGHEQSASEQLEPLPNWVLQKLSAEAEEPRAATPSSLNVSDSQKVAVASPIGPDAGARFLRGNLIHALLEALPDIDPEQREQAAKQFLQRQPQLDPANAEEIAKVTLNVLAHPEFADLFGPESRAELPIVGEVQMAGETVRVRGKIDRLLVRENEVLVLDFKTNRPPPKTVAMVPQTYLDQMASYQSLLQRIWPDKTIRCALLWTEGPDLMELPLLSGFNSA
ncbi:FIG061771: ATP-dependent nuclease subunit A [hydrothermal vent metagenome]|uniref:DNA 3'-5' helicase n=1 Tax=hydrothermal vent metagenome TaxID=652676 RepID=A0A3B0S0H4_9ZZZZ